MREEKRQRERERGSEKRERGKGISHGTFTCIKQPPTPTPFRSRCSRAKTLPGCPRERGRCCHNLEINCQPQPSPPLSSFLLQSSTLLFIYLRVVFLFLNLLIFFSPPMLFFLLISLLLFLTLSYGFIFSLPISLILFFAPSQSLHLSFTPYRVFPSILICFLLSPLLQYRDSTLPPCSCPSAAIIPALSLGIVTRGMDNITEITPLCIQECITVYAVFCKAINTFSSPAIPYTHTFYNGMQTWYIKHDRGVAYDKGSCLCRQVLKVWDDESRQEVLRQFKCGNKIDLQSALG